MPEHYELQVEKLKELESLSVNAEIDLYYGDETHVCSEGYVPYGWQFPDEDVCFLSEKSYKFNCFGLINRQSQCHWQVTQQNINTEFVLEFLEKFSFEIRKKTFVVLDNARIHKTKAIKERIPYWEKRGLLLFFLPPYSPHLNIAETLWRKMKKEWLDPPDYLTEESLAYAINRCLADMGKERRINFSHFCLS
jgi:Transposase and inactivated derivatives